MSDGMPVGLNAGTNANGGRPAGRPPSRELYDGYGPLTAASVSVLVYVPA